jgi:RES domain-containing protein
VPTGWRIVKAARAAAAFDGEGARRYGGRWNSPGTAVVYTAQNESLAVLELLVHLQATHLLTSYASIPAEFGRALVEVVAPAALPVDWRKHPAPAALQQLGDRWAAEARSVVLDVPSALVPNERIFILNPRHSHFGKVTVGRAIPFELDRRLK